MLLFSLSLSLNLPFSLSLSQSLSFSVSLCLSLSLSLSVYLSFSLFLSLSLSFPHSLSLYLFLSYILFLFLSYSPLLYLSELIDQGIDVTILWYNPNIQPKQVRTRIRWHFLIYTKLHYSTFVFISSFYCIPIFHYIF